jgi:hypothetical protein
VNRSVPGSLFALRASDPADGVPAGVFFAEWVFEKPDCQQF